MEVGIEVVRGSVPVVVVVVGGVEEDIMLWTAGKDIIFIFYIFFAYAR